MANYDFGTVVNCRTITPFTTNKVPVDPGGVHFVCFKPDGTLFARYTYGPDPQLVRDGVGMYHVLIKPTMPGDWKYRFYSDVHDDASAQGEFTIDPDILV